jgi:hypothetical protein
MKNQVSRTFVLLTLVVSQLLIDGYSKSRRFTGVKFEGLRPVKIFLAEHKFFYSGSPNLRDYISASAPRQVVKLGL